MIDVSKLVSPSFWLATRPGELSTSFEWVFFVVLVLCYAGFALTKIFQGQYRQRKQFIMVRFLERVASYALTAAVLFTFIFFFRYEGIPLLGARFWFLGWAIMVVAWGAQLVLSYRTEIPRLLQERENYKQFAQYLPKKK